nr:PAS domain S-box protein [Thioalkalivibrio sp.]
MASNPDSAGEALKLLHELQTHQVELDLQYGQLEANEQEIAQERDRYKALFDRAPVGYFTVVLDGRFIETNLAGAELLGVARDNLVGHSVGSFLASESRPALVGLLKELADGRASASCEVWCAGSGGGLRQLHVVADLSVSGESVLMIVSPHHRSPGD